MGAHIPGEEPELPGSISYLWDLHKAIRFSVVPSDEGFSIMPREMLNYREVAAYQRQSGITLSFAEISAIMSVDSIFEKFRG